MTIGFSNITRSVAGLASRAKKTAGSAFDILDPGNARRAISGLFPGGVSGAIKSIPNIGFQSAAGGTATLPAEDDWRVRVSLAENSTIFYKDLTSTPNAIMAPLLETNGVIWPYTPAISVSHVANYTSAQLTHSNYAPQFYNHSDVNEITISGEFTVQSAEEGQYLMAAVYFFRSATKMFFGQGANVGNPPPMVFLDGYGSHYFPHVPCVITNFTHTLSDSVDYLQVPITTTSLEEVEVPTPAPNSAPSLYDDGRGGLTNNLGAVAPDFGSKKLTKQTQYKSITTTTRVPTSSTISVTLRTSYSRKNLHDRFNLKEFGEGKLLQDKNKGYGGFL